MKFNSKIITFTLCTLFLGFSHQASASDFQEKGKEMGEKIEHAKDKSKEVVDHLKDKEHEAKEKAKEVADNVKDSAHDAKEKVKDTAQHCIDKI